MSSIALRPGSTVDSILSAPPPPAMAPRTRLILSAPIAPTLLKLAAPNVLVMLIQAVMGAVDAIYLGWLGPEALAGAALVFPMLMLMAAMSAAGLGGGIVALAVRFEAWGPADRTDDPTDESRPGPWSCSRDAHVRTRCKERAIILVTGATGRIR
jgi:hypothetical protein